VAIGLAVAKLIGGWFGHSLALLSDSVHSLGDSLSCASIFAALWWAERPPDDEHPYGHTRIETIAASYVALVLVGSGVWVGYEVVHSFNGLTPPPHRYTLVIAVASVVLSETISRYSTTVARRTGSKAIEASAWDQRLDACGSMVVLIGLAITTVGGPGWHTVDKIAALIVAGSIVGTGASLFWGILNDLMDRQAEPELLAMVRSLTRAVSGVQGVEKLLVRKAGLEYFVDIHVEVDPEISVQEGHQIGHAVKNRLVSEIAAVKDVLVHIEPFPNAAPGGPSS